MAPSLVLFRPIGVPPCASRSRWKPDSHARSVSSSRWLTPLFRWSLEPDYIDSGNTGEGDLSKKVVSVSVADAEVNPARSRITRGGFTDEKARRLRMMTSDTSGFHDVMYHSAIASRLASDFSNRS